MNDQLISAVVQLRIVQNQQQGINGRSFTIAIVMAMDLLLNSVKRRRLLRNLCGRDPGSSLLPPATSSNSNSNSSNSSSISTISVLFTAYIFTWFHPTMVHNNQESRRKFWATRPSVCSFAHDAHSSTCSTLLVHSDALICSLTCSLTQSQARGTVKD